MPIRSSESFIELTYQYAGHAGWLIVQPDFQYVFMPSGGIAEPQQSRPSVSATKPCSACAPTSCSDQRSAGQNLKFLARGLLNATHSRSVLETSGIMAGVPDHRSAASPFHRRSGDRRGTALGGLRACRRPRMPTGRRRLPGAVIKRHSDRHLDGAGERRPEPLRAVRGAGHVGQDPAGRCADRQFQRQATTCRASAPPSSTSTPRRRRLTLFAAIPRHLAACPGGVGLTTAMTMLKSGWVIVGSLPSSMTAPPRTKGPGCLIVLDSQGNVSRHHRQRRRSTAPGATWR